MIPFSEIVLSNAQTIWDFHYLDLGLTPVDFVLALGSHDERVAVRSAELILSGVAPLLVPSGGLGKVTSDIWSTSEAGRFATIARNMGVPSDRIIVEPTATNTGENIVCTRELLASKGISVRTGVLVAKPYMRRRAYATAAKQWPEVSWFVASPEMTMEAYLENDDSPRQTIELMVGDLQRIRIYGDQGFQLQQEIPTNVWNAYNELVDEGFTKYVIAQ